MSSDSKHNMNDTPMIDLFVVRLDCTGDDPLMTVLNDEPDFFVRGCTGSPATALTQLTRTPCAVVLVSYEVGESETLELVRAYYKIECPNTRKYLAKMVKSIAELGVDA